MLGKSKSRWRSFLTEEQILVANETLIQRNLKLLRETGFPIVIYGTGEGDPGHLGIEEPIFPQTGETLGDMMSEAFAHEWERLGGLDAPADHALLMVGSDAGNLNVQHIREAFNALETHDIVLIPAEDGGFAAIGMNEAHPSIFDMRYSHPNVYRDTIDRCESLGLSVYSTDVVYDMDRKEDLLRSHLGRHVRKWEVLEDGTHIVLTEEGQKFHLIPVTSSMPDACVDPSELYPPSTLFPFYAIKMQ